jgi:hypothetical protein
MSDERRLTLAKLATNIFGIILFALGLTLTYFSIKADVEIVSPRMFTPIGLAVAIIGGLMILAREG